MANVRSSNTIFIDTGNETVLTGKNVRVTFLIATPTNVSNVTDLELKDSETDDLKLKLSLPALNDGGISTYFPFDGNSMVFANGIKTGTISNGTMTLIVEETAS